MAEMIKQEIRKTGNGYDKRRRNTEIEYNCGCKYYFDHHITLKSVCPEYERELVSTRG
jgi:hypothetical protein